MRSRLFLSVCIVVALGFGVVRADQEARELAARLTEQGVNNYLEEDMDAALRDFTRAFEADKHYAPAAHARAAMHFIRGDFGAVDGVLQEYMWDGPGDPDAWILGWIAQMRAGYGSRGMISQIRALVDARTWFADTLDVFLGTLDPEEYLRNVRAHVAVPPLEPDEVEDEEELAEIYTTAWRQQQVRALFYVGQAHIIHNRPEEAVEALEKAVETPGPFQWEREMARADIRRLAGD